jgi:ornithine cyclodeaminase
MSRSEDGDVSAAPRVVPEAEIRRHAVLDEGALAAVEDGFVRLARGEVRQPPVLSLDLPEVHGELDVKTAWVRDWDAFCVKLSTGFFDNPARGMPSASGMMIVLDATTGRPRAVLLDGGLLTELRTAAAGALAARTLARPDASRAAILGAGAQARWQLRALASVRELNAVRVWARRPEAAHAYAREMTDACGVEVRVAATPSVAVADADVVVTTTPSREPLLHAGDLPAGVHVTAMGSDGAGKRELAPDVLERADLVVADDLAQSRRIGELRGVPEDRVAGPVALGAVLAGDAEGRRDAAQRTVCDLTGTGVQDTAIARWLLGRLEAV